MQKIHPQCLLISILPKALPDELALEELQEVKELLETYNAELAELLIQRREIHDKGSYIGKGKMHEAVRIIHEKKIDIVVLNAIVKPGHIYEMKKLFIKSNPHIHVWDRVDLILQIFSKHAHTTEAKLQIELAAMRHMGPRIYGMGMVLSRQTGGIGTRGIGETNTELMKRHWREQMKKIKDKLVKLSDDRKRQLLRRQRIGLRTISFIGYTNAGKTSLFNHLTGKDKHVENALFVTLDSAVGKVRLPTTNKEILVSDTIGFIRNLPANLIDAFRSTFLETITSDILLHVIDASDKNKHEKISIVNSILSDMKLQDKKKLYVFNKIDLLPDEERVKLLDDYKEYTPIAISVKKDEGIRDLYQAIEKTLS